MMRKMSRERRRVMTLSGCLAATGGIMPTLVNRNHKAMLVWVCVEAVLLALLIVRMMRLKKTEGCG
jgi:hypothetical protein